MRAVTWT